MSIWKYSNLYRKSYRSNKQCNLILNKNTHVIKKNWNFIWILLVMKQVVQKSSALRLKSMKHWIWLRLWHFWWIQCSEFDLFDFFGRPLFPGRCIWTCIHIKQHQFCHCIHNWLYACKIMLKWVDKIDQLQKSTYLCTCVGGLKHFSDFFACGTIPALCAFLFVLCSQQNSKN